MTDVTYPGGRIRLHVAGDLAPGASVTLDEGQAHYLRHVMRAGEGAAVRLFNGRHGEWRALLAFSGKRGAVAVCEAETRAQTPPPDLWLLFAPVKKTPGDYIAQKATELGVSVLQPVFTRRTIVDRMNLERLCANAVEAAEQSARLDVPEIRAPLKLAQALAMLEPARRLLFCDEAGGPAILDAARAAGPGPWAVLTGPEGGFDEAERAAIRALPQCVPASLGPRILRADTAALAALAILGAAVT